MIFSELNWSLLRLCHGPPDSHKSSQKPHQDIMDGGFCTTLTPEEKQIEMYIKVQRETCVKYMRNIIKHGFYFNLLYFYYLCHLTNILTKQMKGRLVQACPKEQEAKLLLTPQCGRFNISIFFIKQNSIKCFYYADNKNKAYECSSVSGQLFFNVRHIIIGKKNKLNHTFDYETYMVDSVHANYTILKMYERHILMNCTLIVLKGLGLSNN